MVTLMTDIVSGTAPLTPTFTVNADDPDGDPLTYTWAFGDGAIASIPDSTSHRYDHVGVYTVMVTVSDGQTSASASQVITINRRTDGLPDDPATIAPPLDDTVPTNIFSATEFLYTGINPIQTGVVPGTFEAHRVAVLRGQSLNRDGQPIPGVTINILDHAEYGQTLSRADGMFDLVVNGGGMLTLNYTQTGFLSAQRQVTVPWTDYTWLPDLIMLQLDPNVTAIDLTTNTTMQTARGSVISDRAGQRQATVLFPQGITAVMTMTNGTTQALPALSVRATEFTVGDSGLNAMPGDLPSNSAYTYAFELALTRRNRLALRMLASAKRCPYIMRTFLAFQRARAFQLVTTTARAACGCLPITD